VTERTRSTLRPARAGLSQGEASPVTGGDPRDRAFDALRSYDWGQDAGVLKPIDDAVRASHDDAATREDLERRLVAFLKTEAPRAARDFACRKLSRIGSRDSVPVLAALLTDESLSHMARYALERMPFPETLDALGDALTAVKGKIKVGIINSLGARRDPRSTSRLAALLGDPDPEVAGAAAAALGEIGTLEAAAALRSFQEKSSENLRGVAADACLACAERLVAAGHGDQAREICEVLRSPGQPEHVRLAAARGLSAAAVEK